MLRRNFLCFAITLGLLLLSQRTGFAQNGVELKPQQTGPKTQEVANPSSKPTVDSAASSREQKLAEYLSGAIFSGQFTIDGQSAPKPKAEEYTISKCEKLDEPDLYRLTARIKYGQVDSEVPMNIKILWSGNTPVITLDSLWIPGMGTFGARVLIHSNRYAGTWQHDAVGGHMFGMIRTRADKTQESSKTE